MIVVYAGDCSGLLCEDAGEVRLKPINKITRSRITAIHSSDAQARPWFIRILYQNGELTYNRPLLFCISCAPMWKLRLASVANFGFVRRDLLKTRLQTL